MLQPITILVRYENEVGLQEERYRGFLTGASHAMYVEPEYSDLLFANVVPTENPDVYLEVSYWCSLGRVDRSLNAETIIGSLAERLHRMNAYEFLASVIIHITTPIEFEGLIVPRLLGGA